MSEEPKPDLDHGIISISQSSTLLRSSPFFWIALGAMLLLAGSMLMICLIAMFVVEDRSDHAKNLRCYRELRAILEDVHTARNSPSPDFSAVRKRAAAAKRTMVRDLKQTASTDTSVKQSLRFAVGHELPRMIQGDLLEVSATEKQFAANLDLAAQSLGLK
ncbi:MAG: hypothetical protein JWP89_3900 [Schlesneria sp.]|nr:hypothetical protein [Schlesneria sp.]